MPVAHLTGGLRPMHRKDRSVSNVSTLPPIDRRTLMICVPGDAAFICAFTHADCAKEHTPKSNIAKNAWQTSNSFGTPIAFLLGVACTRGQFPDLTMIATETNAIPTAVESVKALIGLTPLLRISYDFDGCPRAIYAKYESENMTGSVKDRMAIHIIQKAYQNGSLKPGATIVEASSGNTGISFSAIGKALGHDVRIYMPNWMSRERVQLIESFGAQVIPVSPDQGGFIGSVQFANRYAHQHRDCFLPSQFDNDANWEAHQLGTGPELERQLNDFGVQADAFVAGVGTGGTVMGVGRYLRGNGRRVFVHPLEPANSPTLKTGTRAGSHRIQGISDEFVPALLDLDELDEIVDVWDGDAILMAQQLCRQLGLAVGISSGANILGAIRLQEQLGSAATVATLLPDSNKKYLSTDLCGKEPVLDHYFTPRVRLNKFSARR